jgi:splicing factor 3A subunit 2
MSAFEQRVEPANKAWQFLLFACEPYETVGFKIPNVEIDKGDGRFFTSWDAKAKKFTLQLYFREGGPGVGGGGGGGSRPPSRQGRNTPPPPPPPMMQQQQQQGFGGPPPPPPPPGPPPGAYGQYPPGGPGMGMGMPPPPPPPPGQPYY